MNAPERDALAAEARRVRVTATVRADVRALSRYEAPAADGYIKLDAMENPYALPAELAAALGETLAAVPVNRYPESDASGVKDALRESLQLPRGAALLLGNGSDEVIQIVTAAVAGPPEACVVAPEPTFVMYRRTALIAHSPFTGVALREDFSLDIAAMLDVIARERPALVWLAYPNNPTANLFETSDVARIIAATPGLVAIDEAYHPYAGETFLPHVLDFPNVIVVRTLSKLGLAGVRLGYAVGHPAWIDELEKVRPPYNVGRFAQAAVPLLLAHADVFARQAAAIRAERDRLSAALDALPGVHAFPTRTNFVPARFPDAARAFAALRRAKILVKNLHGTHPLLEECLRITVGTPDENDALLAVLRRSEGGRDE